jgi:hypothetical protein
MRPLVEAVALSVSLTFNQVAHLNSRMLHKSRMFLNSSGRNVLGADSVGGGGGEGGMAGGRGWGWRSSRPQYATAHTSRLWWVESMPGMKTQYAGGSGVVPGVVLEERGGLGCQQPRRWCWGGCRSLRSWWRHSCQALVAFLHVASSESADSSKHLA